MTRFLGPLLAVLMVTLMAPATAARDGVPWDQVGDGWVVATIYRGPFRDGELEARTSSIELIAPDGTRYPVYVTHRQQLVNHVDPSNFTLIGWDPDDHTVLLKRLVSTFTDQAIRVDLETGESQTLDLPKSEMATGLRPDGTGVLSQTFGGNVLSITWEGVRTLIGRTGVQGSAITTPDGTAAVIGALDHLIVLPLDGSAQHEIATPGECRALRWHHDSHLLASCYSRKGTQIVTIGLDGSTTPMGGLRRTTSRDFDGPSWQDTDVRIVGGRSYFEGNGPCGGTFIARENAAGQEKVVKVPGSLGGVSIVDARDDRLVVAHTATCDGDPPRAVLSTFDPVSKTEEVLVELRRREQWGHVLAWDEPRPWGY